MRHETLKNRIFVVEIVNPQNLKSKILLISRLTGAQSPKFVTARGSKKLSLFKVFLLIKSADATLAGGPATVRLSLMFNATSISYRWILFDWAFGKMMKLHWLLFFQTWNVGLFFKAFFRRRKKRLVEKKWVWMSLFSFQCLLFVVACSSCCQLEIELKRA